MPTIPMPAAMDGSILPLPTGMRPLLLDLLSKGYPSGALQTLLGNAPDAVVAWQVQSLLDDYADLHFISDLGSVT